MPRYEYRCRECGADFELSRPMAEASAPARCPSGGHEDTVKLLSTVAVGGAAGPAPGGGGGSGGGGCCGGGCCG